MLVALPTWIMGEVRLLIRGGEAVEESLAFLQYGRGNVLGARDRCYCCSERSSSANIYGYGNHQRRNRQSIAIKRELLPYGDLQA